MWWDTWTDYYNITGPSENWHYTSSRYEGKRSEWVWVPGNYNMPPSTSTNPHHEHTDHPYGPNVGHNNHAVEILKDSSFLNTKAECVYDKLNQNSTTFATAIKKFDGEFPVSHLKFSMANLGDFVRGRTYPPENYIITIELNSGQSNSGVGYRPNLLTAKTLMHEVIHAEMFRKMLSLANSNGNINVSNLNTRLQNNDYPGMLDYYTRYGINGFQHQQMARHYRESIGRVLQEFDTGIAIPQNQAPNQLYMDLAWEGLNHSNINGWNNSISQEERDRIDNVIADYINNNKNQNCIE